MQAAKDSFYMTLRGRLAQAYPARTMTVEGTTRPAIVVTENDRPSVKAQQLDTFCVQWGETRAVRPATTTLMAMACTVSYATAGSEQNGGLDRGRMVAEMQSELLGICSPASARKNDYTGASPLDLGSSVFWTAPVFRPAKAAANCEGGEASLTVYFYPEVNQA